MREVIFEITEAEDGGYCARGLGVSICTEADSLDALRAHIQDAVRCHYEDDDAPTIIRLHIVRDEVLMV
jgi:hypothetical protein